MTLNNKICHVLANIGYARINLLITLFSFIMLFKILIYTCTQKLVKNITFISMKDAAKIIMKISIFGGVSKFQVDLNLNRGFFRVT